MGSVDSNVSAFVQKFGLFMERWGMSRSAGRILAWLLVAERPQSLDEMATVLHISKASASLGARACEQMGLAERVSLAGDRKTYYQFKQDAWGSLIRTGATAYEAVAALASEGASAVGDGKPEARERLEEMAQLFRRLADKMPELVRYVEEE